MTLVAVRSLCPVWWYLCRNKPDLVILIEKKKNRQSVCLLEYTLIVVTYDSNLYIEAKIESGVRANGSRRVGW